MSFMSKLTKEFDGLRANLSDKPKESSSHDRAYGRAHQPKGAACTATPIFPQLSRD